MAALAIPIVLLGSIYILSEQEKKDTHKQNNITDKKLSRVFFTENKLNEGYTNYNDANIVDIIHENENVNFIFSNDIGNANINSGVFIVKSTQYSIDFLTKWAYDEDLYKNNPFPCWWDQGVLIEMFNQNILDIKNNCIIIDYGVLQHFFEDETIPNKSFIFHLAGRSREIRINHSLNYIKKINI